MNNERQHGSRKIVRYNVSLASDGRFLETPIYDMPVSSIQETMPQDFGDESYDEVPAFYDDVNEMPPEDAKPPKSTSERKTNSSKLRLRDQPLAKAAFYLAGVTTAIYGIDVGVTYLKDSRVVSPIDAYKDFTELPTLAKPAIDGAQTLIKFVSGK